MSEHNPKTKAELLRHYAKKEPRLFYQMDTFTGMGFDDLLHPDEDGDALCGTWTRELRDGGIPVRVQLAAGTERATVGRLLEKLLAWFRRDGFPLDCAPAGWDDPADDEAEGQQYRLGGADARCGDCRHYHGTPDRTGQCRAGRPTADATGAARWPTVRPDDGCGDFDPGLTL